MTAPGILRNPVPVKALYDWQAAERVTLSNLLQKQGYRDIDEILERGHEEGQLAAHRTVFLELLDERGLEPNAEQSARIRSSVDLSQLKLWLKRILSAQSVEEILT